MDNLQLNINNTDSEDFKKKVWNRAKQIEGRDKNRYRHDPYGNLIFYDSYYKTSALGWHIEYTNSNINLAQAVNTKKYNEKKLSA